jgi:hypothetical protein
MSGGHDEYPVATICGSLRYFDEMIKHAQRLTRQGWIVLMPFVADYVGGAPSDNQKKMLDDMHRAKIDMSDQVYVIGSHIGESTRGEIEYAEARSIHITYL